MQMKPSALAGLAGNVADNISPHIKGAAGATKDKLGDAASGVASAAGAVKDRANIAGAVRSKGMRALGGEDQPLWWLS